MMGYTLAILGIPITVLSILGNLLTIAAVFKTPTLRSRRSVFFTASLAFCDLLFSVLCCPINFATTIVEMKQLNTTFCRINGFLGMLFCLVSILTLAILSFDRYIAIVTPFRYNTVITFKRVKIIIVSKWITATVVAAVPLTGWGNYVFYPEKGFCFIDYKKDIESFVFVGLWFNLCLVFICFSYYHIFSVVKQQRKQIQRLNVRNVGQIEPVYSEKNLDRRRNNLRNFQQENKAALTIFVIVGAFLMCWMPFCTINFTSATIKYTIPKSIDIISTFLVCVGSSVNPLVYGWLDSSFRWAFKRMLWPILRSRRLVPTTAG